MIVQVIGAFIAIFAYAILMESPKKYLWCAGVIGAIGWLGFILGEQVGMSAVLSTFVSAMSIALLSHIFARIFKVPVTVFLIAGILPTVPREGMYRIVSFVLEGDGAMVSHYLIYTLEIAGTIAMAIFIVDTMFRIVMKEKPKKRIDEKSKIV